MSLGVASTGCFGGLAPTNDDHVHSTTGSNTGGTSAGATHGSGTDTSAVTPGKGETGGTAGTNGTSGTSGAGSEGGVGGGSGSSGSSGSSGGSTGTTGGGSTTGGTGGTSTSGGTGGPGGTTGGTGGIGSAGVAGVAGGGEVGGVGGESGTSSGGSDTGASGASAGGLTPGYHLLGAYWNGSVEIIDTIDPSTALGTYVGTMGNLHYWSNQYKLNAATGRLYVIGADINMVPTLYMLDTVTGENAELEVPLNTMILDVTPDDQLLVSAPSGTYDEVFLMNPESGELTEVGHLEGLAFWPYWGLYNPASHEVHAFGGDSDLNYFLFSLNIETHEHHKVPIPMENVGPMAGIGASGEIIYCAYHASQVSLNSIHPTTGEIKQLTGLYNMTGVAQLGAVSYDPDLDTAYVVQWQENGSLFHTFDLGAHTHTVVPIGPANILATL